MIMKRRTAFPVGVASLALCGCAQLAGIDTTSGKDFVGDSLTLERISIGATVSTAPLDLTGLTASFLPPGKAAVGATTTAPGVWTTGLGDPAPVEYTLPDTATPDQPAFPRVLSLPTQALKASFSELSHPSPIPAPVPASLAFNVPLDAAPTGADTFEMFVVGAWAHHTFLPAELPPVGGTAIATTLDYGTVMNQSTKAGLVAITADDALLVLRHTGPALTGATEAQPFTQTGTDTVSTPKMTAVAADQMVTASVDPIGLAARLSTVRPAAASGLSLNWAIRAAPGGAVGDTNGPQLQVGSLPTTMTSFTVTYGNPFTAAHPTWTSVFVFTASQARTFSPPGSMLSMTLSACLTQIGPAAPSLTLDAKAGLANNIKLGGQLLSVDGVAIAPPTGDVALTFDTDDATGDSFRVELFDIVPNAANTALIGSLRLVTFSDKPSIGLPASLLQAGHYYTLRVIVDNGAFPQLAIGDVQIAGPAFSQSLVDSAVFTVTP